MQLSNEIIKVLDYLGEKIGITIDWTSSNVIPIIKDLCEKYITWEIWTSIAWIVICSIALIVVIIVTIIIAKKFDDGDDMIPVWLVISLLLALFISGIITQTFDIIECKTFPEKAIYEYISENIDND